MLKFVGIESETFVSLRNRNVGIEVSPGQTYEFDPGIEEALFESGKFEKVRVKAKEKVEDKGGAE